MLADKAANNIILVCKRLYAHAIRQELNAKDSAYTAETRALEEILDTHRSFMENWQLNFISKLPSLSGLPKMHKPKMALRYIAGSGHCSVNIASQLLGKMLACVDKSIRELNDRLLLETGVRRYFIIRDGFEVSDFIECLNSNY